MKIILVVMAMGFFSIFSISAKDEGTILQTVAERQKNISYLNSPECSHPEDVAAYGIATAMSQAKLERFCQQ